MLVCNIQSRLKIYCLLIHYNEIKAYNLEQKSIMQFLFPVRNISRHTPLCRLLQIPLTFTQIPDSLVVKLMYMAPICHFLPHAHDLIYIWTDDFSVYFVTQFRQCNFSGIMLHLQIAQLVIHVLSTMASALVKMVGI